MAHTKVQMSHLTASTMREVAARNPVILLPLGSFEDQGPHMPMGDYLLADAMAERIAQQATQNGLETYVAPVLPFGGADYFGYMPGGIALSQTTFQAVLTDMLTGLLRHGLTRLIILNGHGGNCTMIHDVTHALWRQNNVVIPSFYLWRVAASLMSQTMDAEVAGRSGGHGANPLTSIGMFLKPELIENTKIPTQSYEKTAWGLKVLDFGTVDLNGVPVSIPLEGDSTATQGVGRGNPALCNAEDGKILTQKLVDYGVQLVAHVMQQSALR